MQAGLLSREIKEIRVPTQCSYVEGNITSSATRELLVDPTRSENLRMYGNLHAREPGDPMPAYLVDRQTGRSDKAKAAILR